MILDGEGVYGTFLSYAQIFFFSGGALILFLYFWSQGRLDMDEDPKYQMMDEKGEFKE